MKELPNLDPHAREVGGLLSLLVGLFHRDNRANKPWHVRSYDRVVRVIGALILVAILVGMLYVALTRNP